MLIQLTSRYSICCVLMLLVSISIAQGINDHDLLKQVRRNDLAISNCEFAIDSLSGIIDSVKHGIILLDSLETDYKRLQREENLALKEIPMQRKEIRILQKRLSQKKPDYNLLAKLSNEKELVLSQIAKVEIEISDIERKISNNEILLSTLGKNELSLAKDIEAKQRSLNELQLKIDQKLKENEDYINQEIEHRNAAVAKLNYLNIKEHSENIIQRLSNNDYSDKQQNLKRICQDYMRIADAMYSATNIIQKKYNESNVRSSLNELSLIRNNAIISDSVELRAELNRLKNLLNNYCKLNNEAYESIEDLNVAGSPFSEELRNKIDSYEYLREQISKHAKGKKNPIDYQNRCNE